MDESVASAISDQTVSEIHHSLQAPRRRLIILILTNRLISQFDLDSVLLNYTGEAEDGGVMSAREISKLIVALEDSIPPDQVTNNRYHNVYSAVTQHHLDRLDQVGAVEYDQDRKTVEPGRNLLVFASVALICSPLSQLILDADLGVHRHAEE